MGFFIVGYYNYSLFNQTKRVENLLTYLEEQRSKLRVIQSVEVSNASRVAEQRQTALQRELSAPNKSRQWDDIFPGVRTEQCKVNLSSGEQA